MPHELHNRVVQHMYAGAHTWLATSNCAVSKRLVMSCINVNALQGLKHSNHVYDPLIYTTFHV